MTRFPWHGLGCVLLLDRFTETNGATRIVPRSHASEADPFAVMEDALAPYPAEILVLGEPGDALIYASNLWHGGTQNVDGASRRCLHVGFGRRGRLQQTSLQQHLNWETFHRLSPAHHVLLQVEAPVSPGSVKRQAKL